MPFRPLRALLLGAAVALLGPASLQAQYFMPHSQYYAPNDTSVVWNGNRATIVVFGFSHVRQGEVWLSHVGEDGKDVLQCPQNGLLFATYVFHALNAATHISQGRVGEIPMPKKVAALPMGEHVAEYYAVMAGDDFKLAPYVRIDFGPKDSTERHSYTFNRDASYRLLGLLQTMCKSLRGPHSHKDSQWIEGKLKWYRKKWHYNPPPAPAKK